MPDNKKDAAALPGKPAPLDSSSIIIPQSNGNCQASKRDKRATENCNFKCPPFKRKQSSNHRFLTEGKNRHFRGKTAKDGARIIVHPPF
ncbi:MAG: hypothetical protein IKH21_06580, partial [Clostridia bacterium]|nr:hypothetical protein [Clostridia bacterium]